MDAIAAAVRVFVIEDALPIRQALQMLLDGSPGVVCIGAVGTAEAALAAEATTAPDVVLVDIGLPAMSGIDALPLLRGRWPRAELLMLTIHEDETRVFASLRAGATGYLLKSTPPAALIEAIHEAYLGGAPMSASIARQVVHAFHRPDPTADVLSARERAVLDGLMAGKTYRQIGEDLFISINTVAFHVKQIYQKLHIHSRAEAFALTRPGL